MDPASLDDIYGDESSGRDYGGGIYLDEGAPYGEFRRTTQQARADARAGRTGCYGDHSGRGGCYSMPHGGCGGCHGGCGGGCQSGCHGDHGGCGGGCRSGCHGGCGGGCHGDLYPNQAGRLGFFGGEPSRWHPPAMQVVSERGPYHAAYDVGWDERPAHYAPGAGEEAHLRVDPRDRPYYGGAAPSLQRPLARDTLAGARATADTPIKEGFVGEKAAKLTRTLQAIAGVLLVIVALLAGVLATLRRICAAVCGAAGPQGPQGSQAAGQTV